MSFKMSTEFIKYKNLNGNSPILEYRLNNDNINSIDIVFKSKNDSYYRYSNKKISLFKIKEMKILAKKGSGLSTYININIKTRHDSINKK